ncbi:hypothetical protein BDR26DRAFT_892865 [Obelidium mucronatum]|nr:hypothetical protein BDR26DRAFT_892865 [Obelidium mucronatum]
MTAPYRHAGLARQAVPGKGAGLVSRSFVEDGALLHREAAFEWWAAAAFEPAPAAARLLQRSRASAAVRARLAPLHPAAAALLPPAAAASRTTAARVAAVRAALDQSECAPSDADIVRLLFVIQCNSFPSGFLIDLSAANHSCNPNAAVFEEDPSAEDPDAPDAPVYSLWSKRDIQPGEEVTISYLDMTTMILPCKERQMRLAAKFLFQCTCEWCHTEIPAIGLNESPTYGPKFEDFTCAAFYTVAACNGAVNPLTGVCNSCNKSYNLTQVTYVSRASDALIAKLQKQLAQIYSFLRGIESMDQRETTMVQELTRLKNELDESLLEAEKLFHETHLAFAPIKTCLEKVGSILRREAYRNRIKRVK